MARSVQGILCIERSPRPDCRSVEVCLEETLFRSQPECISACYQRVARADVEYQPQPAQHHGAGDCGLHSLPNLDEYGRAHYHILGYNSGLVAASIVSG